MPEPKGEPVEYTTPEGYNPAETSPTALNEIKTGTTMNNYAAAGKLGTINEVQGWDQAIEGVTGGSKPDFKIVYQDGTTGYGDYYQPEPTTQSGQILKHTFDKGKQTQNSIVFLRWGAGVIANESVETFLDRAAGKLGTDRSLQGIVAFDDNFTILGMLGKAK